MALRILVAFLIALRAVLVYGEVGRLTTEPVRLPRFRLRRAARPALAPAEADAQALA
jgi:hypothetical protein